jgi:dsDNA-specific endonuclease/ATPase MutS2
MSSFKPGDKVEVIDETIRGVIQALTGEWVYMVTDEGFEMRVKPREIVKIEDNALLKVNRREVSIALKEKMKGVGKPKKSISSKNKERFIKEVDLHIHELVESTSGMAKYEILTLQLEMAKAQLETAFKNRLQRVIFIHGVGEGILKNELKNLFKGYDNITFYDADYRRYGQGATEVYIYQNPD